MNDQKLKEASETAFPYNEFVSNETIDNCRKLFMEGAKWQQQQSPDIDGLTDVELKNLLYFGSTSEEPSNNEVRIDYSYKIKKALELAFSLLETEGTYNSKEIERVFWERIKKISILSRFQHIDQYPPDLDLIKGSDAVKSLEEVGVEYKYGTYYMNNMPVMINNQHPDRLRAIASHIENQTKKG